ncbi:MAG: dockerin type I domain-containing protein [Planctomycetia bacterium]
MDSYDGWVNMFDGQFPTDPDERVGFHPLQPTWGVLLTDDYMIENSNGSIGSLLDGGGAVIQDTFEGFNMINTTTPIASMPTYYDLSVTMSYHDNDGQGVIFGYQDEDNFFRASLRKQPTSNGNFEEGISLQKFVSGVCTEIAVPVSPELLPAYGTDFTLGVSVTEFLEIPKIMVSFDSTPVIEISDSDLLPGQYGVFSWAQSADWGTNIKQVELTSTTINNTHTFTDTGAVTWTNYMMANSAGVTIGDEGVYTHPQTVSNYRLDFENGTIIQDADNYVTPTTGFERIDFLAPAAVVDDPDSVNWDDYTLQVRMANQDNDGIGLMVRVQDNSTFYRIEFVSEDVGTSTTRPYEGMSVQKCVNGVWTELYHEEAESVLFNYTPETRDTEDPTIITQEAIPFDVKVTVDGNAISVEVIDDPDGASPTTYVYPTVYDNGATFIETGSVGFTAWASGGGSHRMQSIYSGYGGDMNAPLVVELAEDLPGDANHDDQVDASDATILAGNWQAGPGATWEMGDFNGDGYVDASDATILAGNWQAGTGATAVPEPSTIVLLLMGLGSLLIWKVKR